jgi:hypothetical protein
VKFQNAIAISLLMTAAAACGDDDDNHVTTSSAVYAPDGVYTTDWDSAAMYAVTDPIADPFFLAQRVGSAATSSTTITPAQAAQSAAESADQYFSPKDCVRAKADGDQVTYDLADCQGPFGLQRIDGTLIVQFLAPDEVSVDAGIDAGIGAGSGEIGISIKSSGLTINAAEASITAQGIYSRTSSGQKRVTLTSTSKHSRNGAQITGNTTASATWAQGSQCVNVDATGDFVARGNTYNLRVEDYTRCVGQCPKSGSVRLAGGDQTITVTLNGTDRPPYKNNNGPNGSVTLECTNVGDTD